MCKVDIDSWPSYYFNGSYYIYINKRFGPIPDHFLLVSWDIVAMYPSINNALGMEACRKALDKREKLKPSTDCIMEAIELTLENNNSTFIGKHYL